MECAMDTDAGNGMVPDDNAPLPKSAIMALSVRAQHILEKMSFPKTFGGIRGVTYEEVKRVQHAGDKTAREIMDFRDRCLSGSIALDSQFGQDGHMPPEPIRIDDPLPPLAVEGLSIRARNILEKNGIEKTPRGICALDGNMLKGFKGAGKMVVEELMKLQGRCLDGSVWDDEVVKGIDPGQFGSLSEFVMAVAGKTCRLGKYGERIIADYLGLLNVRQQKTLEAIGVEIGGLTRERVRQIAEKIENALFSATGKAMFSEFVQCAKAIFERGNWFVRVGGLAAGLEAAYPGWSGTTEFSALRLLAGCGMEIEVNDSGIMAWMTDGKTEERYQRYLGLLNDESVPLEDLTQEAVLRNADLLGLEGITEDEFRFLVQRAFDKDRHVRVENPSRWDLFLRLRCGLRANSTERRRYAVARALRAAGMRALTADEIVCACREIDPDADIGDEKTLDSDANPLQKYDMDGTGARLIVFDYGDRENPKRYCLDVFSKDKGLINTLKAAGERLREHMERNCLGAANITQLVEEVNADLPEPYAAQGLPSACIYSLMREHGMAGLRYFDHPNVAHPDILRGNGGLVPAQAISWVIYEYFLMAGHESATSSQLQGFCVEMLGMNGTIAGATVLREVKGDKVVVDGDECFMLKPPNPDIDPPNMLLDSGQIDSELSFGKPWEPQGMNRGADGKALDFSTYVRDFLLKLKESGFAFSQDDESELADPGWCRWNIGPRKAVFLRAQPGTGRPSTNYWRITYRVGRSDYWVNSYWPDKYKPLFDRWAQSLARRAGFPFEPYDLP